MQLEIDRLENKIRSLSEMAVNRQEPEYISSQVDSVAASMLQTEQTMNELKFVTGLDPAGEEAPRPASGHAGQSKEVRTIPGRAMPSHARFTITRTRDSRSS